MIVNISNLGREGSLKDARGKEKHCRPRKEREKNQKHPSFEKKIHHCADHSGSGRKLHGGEGVDGGDITKLIHRRAGEGNITDNAPGTLIGKLFSPS